MLDLLDIMLQIHKIVPELLILFSELNIHLTDVLVVEIDFIYFYLPIVSLHLPMFILVFLWFC